MMSQKFKFIARNTLKQSFFSRIERKLQFSGKSIPYKNDNFKIMFGFVKFENWKNKESLVEFIYRFIGYLILFTFHA